ncbi:unnamed protein product [Symbiodinium necroappetens]|uniref:Uncharacterized protein n=1 Tax=Symbiodinium necroappetens TaxID=1628268 RepID=A0A812XZ18_9DINO|nr:unnamed protein product [Symbiodinium sp. CCMP2456]CAE7755908.1 unnamed protein product [Symbiodinium necroappetens]
MFHNKQRGKPGAIASPSKRLRNRVHNLFLSSSLSAIEAAGLETDAAECGLTGFKKAPEKSSKNASRDMLRRCLKKSQWPPIYTAEIRIWDEKHEITRYADVAFMLPHEVLYVLFQKNPGYPFTDLACCAQSVQNHCLETSRKLGVHVIPFSLWTDATPFNWDRSTSLEVILMSLPQLPAPHHTWRFPVTGLPKNNISKGESFEDIWDLMAWSSQQLLLGIMPRQRHDGQPFKEPWRNKHAGRTIAHRCILAELRADWKCLAEVFGLPHWGAKTGICMRCSACLSTYKDCSENAPWMLERYGHWDFLLRQKNEARLISSIFRNPFFTTTCFKMDWLHVMDLGCAQDCIGNLYWHVLPKLGNNQKVQVAQLYLQMKKFYKDNGIQDCIGKLTLGMIKKPDKKKPKMNLRAAETRAMIPFAWRIADEKLDRDDVFESAIRWAIKYLVECYDCLSALKWEPSYFRKCCFAFLRQYSSLEAMAEEGKWVMKPKFHMLAEIALAGDKPSDNWVYRDEEAGGTMARVAHAKGGPVNQWSIATRVLNKFSAEFSVPHFD